MLKSDLRTYTKKEFQREELKLKSWSNGKMIAIVLVLNVEIYTKFGISIQPHLTKNNPDVANTGWRNYGNRNGLPRLTRIFEELETPFDLMLNADVLTEEPFVWESLIGGITFLPNGHHIIQNKRT